MCHRMHLHVIIIIVLFLSDRLAFLSGPSFAAEVADEQPTAVTIASHDESVSKSVQEIMSTVRFRCYTTTDVVGVEFGGALKNVLAIACGISDGLGFGCNARAALMTRGMSDSKEATCYLSLHDTHILFRCRSR